MGWLGDRLRDLEVAAQGFVRGVASGAGSLLDAPSAIGNLGVAGLNLMRSDENQIDYFNSPNFAGRAANMGIINWTEAETDRERAIMSGAQAVGEVGGFVVATVATGGLGGAAVGASIATARGTAIGARAITAAQSGAGFFASAGNPLNVTGRVNQGLTAAEGVFVATRSVDLYNQDADAAELQEEIGVDAVREETDGIVREEESIQRAMDEIVFESQNINQALQDTSLSAEERQSYLDRIEELDQGAASIDALVRGEDLSTEERQGHLDRLETIVPQAFITDETDPDLGPESDTGMSSDRIRNIFEGIQNGNGETYTPEPIENSPVFEMPAR